MHEAQAQSLSDHRARGFTREARLHQQKFLIPEMLNDTK